MRYIERHILEKFDLDYSAQLVSSTMNWGIEQSSIQNLALRHSDCHHLHFLCLGLSLFLARIPFFPKDMMVAKLPISVK